MTDGWERACVNTCALLAAPVAGYATMVVELSPGSVLVRVFPESQEDLAILAACTVPDACGGLTKSSDSLTAATTTAAPLAATTVLKLNLTALNDTEAQELVDQVTTLLLANAGGAFDQGDVDTVVLEPLQQEMRVIRTKTAINNACTDVASVKPFEITSGDITAEGGGATAACTSNAPPVGRFRRADDHTITVAYSFPLVVRRLCPPIFLIFLPHFRLYEVVSLHMCVSSTHIP